MSGMDQTNPREDADSTESAVALVVAAVRGDLQRLLAEHIQEVRLSTDRIVEVAIQRARQSQAHAPVRDAKAPAAEVYPEFASRDAVDEPGKSHMPRTGIALRLPSFQSLAWTKTAAVVLAGAALGIALSQTTGVANRTSVTGAVVSEIVREVAEPPVPVIDPFDVVFRDLSVAALRYDGLFQSGELKVALSLIGSPPTSVVGKFITEYTKDPSLITQGGQVRLLNALTQRVLMLQADGVIQWQTRNELKGSAAPALRDYLESRLKARYDMSLDAVAARWPVPQFSSMLGTAQRWVVIESLQDVRPQ